MLTSRGYHRTATAAMQQNVQSKNGKIILLQDSNFAIQTFHLANGIISSRKLKSHWIYFDRPDASQGYQHMPVYSEITTSIAARLHRAVQKGSYKVENSY